MSKQYHDSATGGHIPFRQARHSHLIGTPTFASINCHLGAELSWCDDLESLAYVLIYFLCGLLPWLQVDKRAKKNFKSSILNIKQTTLVEASCSGLPVEMSTILIYTHMLSFSETPDYDYIWSLLTSLQNSSLSPTNIASFIRDELHLSDPHTTTHNDPKYLCNEVAQFYDSPLKKHGMNSPPSIDTHSFVVLFLSNYICADTYINCSGIVITVTPLCMLFRVTADGGALSNHGTQPQMYYLYCTHVCCMSMEGMMGV